MISELFKKKCLANCQNQLVRMMLTQLHTINSVIENITEGLS